MSNRKALSIMFVALVIIWVATFALEYAGIPHIRKLATILTIALSACMFGAFLHFLAKRIF